MLVQLKLAGPSPPPPPAPPARWAEEGMAQLISTAPTFACKTVPYGNDIYDFGDISAKKNCGRPKDISMKSPRNQFTIRIMIQYFKCKFVITMNFTRCTIDVYFLSTI